MIKEIAPISADSTSTGEHKPVTLPDVFVAAAESHPGATMVHIGGRDLPYADGLAAARRLAHWLRNDGLQKGDRVLICLPNHPGIPIVCMAAWLAGAVVVTGSVLDTIETLAFKARDSGARLLVGADDDTLAARLEEAAAGLAPVRRISELIAHASDRAEQSPLPLGTDADAVALLQYTGGTTGEPKAAMLTHANMVVNGRQMTEALEDLRPGAERFLLAAPLSHITGMATMLLALSTAAEMVFLPRFQAEQAVRLIAERRITYLIGVPTMYNAMLQPGVSARHDWASVRFALVGGAPVTSTLADAFASATGGRLLAGYGLSETAPAVTLMRPSAPAPAGSAGQAVPDTAIQIRSTEDPAVVLTPGTSGEICVAGPQVTPGYWQKPEATAQAFVDGYFRTGDIGFVDADGHLHVVDRLKDMIIASGFNVYPAHVEEAIARCPKVREVAVIGEPDAYRGETVKAVVALRDNETLSLEELQAFLKGKLSPVEMPKLLTIMPELPKSAAGKVLRRQVRAVAA